MTIDNLQTFDDSNRGKTFKKIAPSTIEETDKEFEDGFLIDCPMTSKVIGTEKLWLTCESRWKLAWEINNKEDACNVLKNKECYESVPSVLRSILSKICNEN